MKATHSFIGLLILISMPLFAQEKTGLFEKLSDFKIEPRVNFQFWTAYGMNYKVFNPETLTYDEVDDRFSAMIRRMHTGLRGNPYPGLYFNITGAYDFIGKDRLVGQTGGSNNGASPAIRLWNGYVYFRPNPEDQRFNIVVGYFVPQLGRESMSSAFRSGSIEKSWDQNYYRRHMVGIGPGRAAGINLGGLFYEATRDVNWGYDIGIFSPPNIALNFNTAGIEKAAALFTGRINLQFGDPEKTTYSPGLKTNYKNQRRGLSIGLGASYRGETDLHERTYTLASDALWNFGPLNVDAEYLILGANGANDRSAQSNVGHFRISYNFTQKNDKIVEPAFLWVWFDGALDAGDQADAMALGTFAGTDQLFDAGINYHLNADWVLELHYTWRKGDAGDFGPGATFNNYFFESGVGAINRGNWLGLGVNILL